MLENFWLGSLLDYRIIAVCVSLSLLQQVSEFELFTLDDIDTAFQNVTRLTYSQNYHLSGKISWLLTAC